MRTIDELEYILNKMDKHEPHEDTFLMETLSLRHLVAIARAAEYRLKACEDGNQDSFAAADDLLDSEVSKARNAGLFGKLKGEDGR